MGTKAHRKRIIEKLPSTNNKAYRARVRSYLAEATEVDGNDQATEQERLNHLVERLKAEVGWMIKGDGSGRYEAAIHWLQGLAINVEYLNSEIPSTVLKLHGLEGETLTDALSERLINGWWRHLADNVVRLMANHERTGNA